MKTTRYFITTFLLSFFCGAGFVSSYAATKSYNPCEFAYNNIIYIKEQTENAFNATDLKMMKYHAYKALDGIWNAQYSFEKCGCEDVLTSIDLANANLKKATTSTKMEDAKIFLHLATENSKNSLNAIIAFQGNESKYGNDVLVLNTKEANTSEKVSPWLDEQSRERIEKNLDAYRKSLKNVIELNDCDRAMKFIAKTQQNTRQSLHNPQISQRKQYYHYRVLEITEELIKTMDPCTTEQLLARK